MKDLIISVVLCSCAGTFITMLCPKTSVGKPIVFLCSAVVTAAVISVVHSSLTSDDLTFDLPGFSEYDYVETANGALCSAVEKTVAENLFSVVYGFLGIFPESVNADVDYRDGQFYLISADVCVKTEAAEELKEHIYEKTGLDVSVCEP